MVNKAIFSLVCKIDENMMNKFLQLIHHYDTQYTSDIIYQMDCMAYSLLNSCNPLLNWMLDYTIET